MTDWNIIDSPLGSSSWAARHSRKAKYLERLASQIKDTKAILAFAWFSREYRKGRVDPNDIPHMRVILAAAAELTDLDRLSYRDARLRMAGRKWVYLDGRVQFGAQPHVILQQLAADKPQAFAVANHWLAGNGIPHGNQHAIAQGEMMPNGEVMIYMSNTDRNTVRDAVEHSFDRPAQQPFRHMAPTFASAWTVIAKADHEGAMVSLDVPPHVAKHLALKGGEDHKDLHITLAYFDDGLFNHPEVSKIIGQVASTLKPVEVKTKKVEEFPKSKDDGDVPVVLICEGPELDRIHEALTSGLKGVGEKISERYEFNPHITLKYKKESEETEDLKHLLDIPMKFDKIHLHNAGDITEFPLGQAVEV